MTEQQSDSTVLQRTVTLAELQRIKEEWQRDPRFRAWWAAGAHHDALPEELQNLVVSDGGVLHAVPAGAPPRAPFAAYKDWYAKELLRWIEDAGVETRGLRNTQAPSTAVAVASTGILTVDAPRARLYARQRRRPNGDRTAAYDVYRGSPEGEAFGQSERIGLIFTHRSGQPCLAVRRGCWDLAADELTALSTLLVAIRDGNNGKAAL